MSLPVGNLPLSHPPHLLPASKECAAHLDINKLCRKGRSPGSWVLLTLVSALLTIDRGVLTRRVFISVVFFFNIGFHKDHKKTYLEMMKT